VTRLRQAAENYLALRRSLGFILDKPGRLVLDFADHLDAAGASHITIDLAADWAAAPAGAAPYWHWYRLSAVRGFAAYLHAFDAGHQVPPAGLLPRHGHRIAPHLFTDDQVVSLMRAAWGHPVRLHAATYATLIGLLAVTGIRPGECYRLERDDIDLDRARLTVVKGKYGKTRQLTLQPSTVTALDTYAQHRDRLCPRPAGPSFFVTLTGSRLTPQLAGRAFRLLAGQTGLRAGPPRARPRLMDLRHTFAVSTLIGWYRDGLDVDARLPVLATWLGHVHVASTYWYLQASPELLALAAEKATLIPGNLKE
jgi:integrase